MLSGELVDKISSKIWRMAFETSPQALLFTQPDETIVHLNETALRFLGLPKEEIVGRSWGDVLNLLPGGLSQILRFHKVRLEVEGMTMISLRDSREELYLQRVLSFFANTLKALDSPTKIAMSPHELIQNAVQLAVRDICDWSRIDLRPDLNLGRGACAHIQANLETTLSSLVNADEDELDGILSPFRVIRSGFPVFRNQVEKASLNDQQTLLGLHSYICVPIRRGADTIGSLTLVRTENRPAFDSMDLLMAEEMATKIGVNMEKALLYRHLLELKDAAEKANSAKTNFLANISHEIRTPLGAVLGFADLLISTPPTLAERTDWADRIRDNGGHLLRLIDDILDLSKVEVGHLDIKLEKVDLQNLLYNVQSSVSQKALGKKLAVEFVVEGPLPRFILSDETRLSQILGNVVGNAIKFTPSGMVRIRISKSAAHEKKIFFEVQDSGVGIAQDQTALLFQPFSQVDMSRTRQFGGTGLGLALSRGLARHLGGDLVLQESHVNQGSVFLISVGAEPLGPEEFFSIASSGGILEEPKEDLTRALEGRKILVVEDSVDIQALLQRILESAGAKIDIAANGAEGVRAALDADYDAILMDVQMPVMDGCQAVQELRLSGYGGLVVALTANAMLDEQKRCLEAGFDLHMSKPMRRRDLIQSLRRLTASSIQ